MAARCADIVGIAGAYQVKGANRERYGFSYITVHGPYLRQFGPVIERLRG